MKEVFDVRRSADSDDVLKCLNGQFNKVVAITADYTVEDIQSGTIFTVDTTSTGESLEINLPVCAQGLHFRFFFIAAGAQIVNIDAKADTDFFLGYVTDSEAGSGNVAFNGSSHDRVVWGASHDAGDFVEIVGTATNDWLLLPTTTSKDIGEVSAATASGNS